MAKTKRKPAKPAEEEVLTPATIEATEVTTETLVETVIETPVVEMGVEEDVHDVKEETIAVSETLQTPLAEALNEFLDNTEGSEVKAEEEQELPQAALPNKLDFSQYDERFFDREYIARGYTKFRYTADELAILSQVQNGIFEEDVPEFEQKMRQMARTGVFRRTWFGKITQDRKLLLVCVEYNNEIESEYPTLKEGLAAAREKFNWLVEEYKQGITESVLNNSEFGESLQAFTELLSGKDYVARNAMKKKLKNSLLVLDLPERSSKSVNEIFNTLIGNIDVHFQRYDLATNYVMLRINYLDLNGFQSMYYSVRGKSLTPCIVKAPEVITTRKVEKLVMKTISSLQEDVEDLSDDVTESTEAFEDVLEENHELKLKINYRDTAVHVLSEKVKTLENEIAALKATKPKAWWKFW